METSEGLGICTQFLGTSFELQVEIFGVSFLPQPFQQMGKTLIPSGETPHITIQKVVFVFLD
jgi:hypothetical protein